MCCSRISCFSVLKIFYFYNNTKNVFFIPVPYTHVGDTSHTITHSKKKNTNVVLVLENKRCTYIVYMTWSRAPMRFGIKRARACIVNLHDVIVMSNKRFSKV